MSRYGKMKSLSVKKFSDKEPAAIQNFETRKELKENEEIIRKGHVKTWIAISIASFALLVTIAGWPIIQK